MGSLGNPKTWVPYLNNKDCSQGFCSLYCPQWCYIIYPPPPPLAFPRAAAPSATISPLVVAIIGVLASAFLLVTYYTIISKYCGRRAPDQRRSSSSAAATIDDDDDDEPPLHGPWHVATVGLDEAAINAIAVHKYRRGDGSVEGTDCSVCLSEFEEDESVRLLPKCSHAFHIQCIDTWLRSHSNCPLCRASVAAAACAGPPESVISSISDEFSTTSSSREESSSAPGGQNSSPGDIQEGENVGSDSRSLRALSDFEERHAVIEVREEMRRSVSMDFSRPGDIRVRIDCDCEEAEDDGVGDVEEGSVERGHSSKFVSGKVNGCRHLVKVNECPVAMKRSVSSGRFFLRRNNSVIPL